MKAKESTRPQEEVLRKWWQALQPRTDQPRNAGQFSALGRGDLARLRHCASIEEVMLTAAYHHLSHAMHQCDAGAGNVRFDRDPDALALVAGLLSHVRNDTKRGTSFAAILGTTGKSGKPYCSEMRFQRLLSSENETDLYRQMIRAIRMVEDSADVVSLARDLMLMAPEFRDGGAVSPARRVKTRWADQYFRHALNLPAIEA